MNSQATRPATVEDRRLDPDRPEVHMRYKPLEDLTQYAIDFARERPEVAALWCFSLGFILGWRLKPW
jgi:hypothetical protein